MGKVVAITNQKGGVGKTTTAINLGASLAILNKKVLIIDIDPQGNSTTGLGIDKNEIIKKEKTTIYELLLSDEDVDYNDVLLKTQVPNLYIIPATTDLAGAEIELASAIAREIRLKKHMNELQKKFDYILIDCPPSLGLLTVNAMTAANSILIPLQTEFFALEGLAELLNSVRLIQKVLNPTLYIEGIILTMYDGRLNLCKQVEQEIKKWFGDKVFKTTIAKNVKLAEAPSHGKPIILYDILSVGAQNYIDLAKEFIKRNAKKG